MKHPDRNVHLPGCALDLDHNGACRMALAHEEGEGEQCPSDAPALYEAGAPFRILGGVRPNEAPTAPTDAPAVCIPCSRVTKTFNAMNEQWKVIPRCAVCMTPRGQGASLAAETCPNETPSGMQHAMGVLLQAVANGLKRLNEAMGVSEDVAALKLVYEPRDRSAEERAYANGYATALETAAQVCELERDEYNVAYDEMKEAADNCAIRIRKLPDAPGGVRLDYANSDLPTLLFRVLSWDRGSSDCADCKKRQIGKFEWQHEAECEHLRDMNAAYTALKRTDCVHEGCVAPDDNRPDSAPASPCPVGGCIVVGPHTKHEDGNG